MVVLNGDVDGTDLKILEMLGKDSRRPLREIGEELGVLEKEEDVLTYIIYPEQGLKFLKKPNKTMQPMVRSKKHTI